MKTSLTKIVMRGEMLKKPPKLIRNQYSYKTKPWLIGVKSVFCFLRIYITRAKILRNFF